LARDTKRSAELLYSLYAPGLYVYNFAGKGLLNPELMGHQPSHRFPPNIPWADWGANRPPTGVFQLRGDAAAFVKYTKKAADNAPGCIYLWAHAGEELQPL